MLNGGSNFKESKQTSDAPESKPSALDRLQNGLEKAASKVAEMFSDDYKDGSKAETTETTENSETSESPESNEGEKQESSSATFKELFEKLFSDDFLDSLKQPQESNESDNSEANIQKSVPENMDDGSSGECVDSDDSNDDSTEYNEDGTRELTDDEKQELKDKLGWSDEKLKKCTIDENGVIHYKTDRSDLEGQTSENGVPYERRRIEINGIVIEGVFPKFESAFDTELPPDKLKTNAYANECNKALKEAIKNDPELRSKFTDEQLQDIEAGRTPKGYVWHHNEEPGKMQLVKREDHDRVIGGAAHTGGSSLWGADSVDNSKKGESF